MKISELRAEMRHSELDAVIIYDEFNQRYLSDFAFSDGLLLITTECAELITDFRYIEAAEKSADREFHVSAPKDKDEVIKRILSDACVKRLGFEGKTLPYASLVELKKKYSDIEFVDIDDMVEKLRMIKTAAELQLIGEAQKITDGAFTHVLKHLTPNMTEIEVAAELEYFMRKSGADGFSFDTIAVSGDASAMPHGVPRPIKLKRGFLTMDFGAKFNGYCSDMTRTVVIGAADKEMKRLYSTVLLAQRSALDYISVGADAGEADKKARDIINSVKEFCGAFGHSLGHSLGLLVHEAPNLSPRAFGRKMRSGEVYTVEPGIYLKGKYGCRIEDMVAVCEDKIINFTASTKDLIEIS